MSGRTLIIPSILRTLVILSILRTLAVVVPTLLSPRRATASSSSAMPVSRRTPMQVVIT
jgi:hypothetical protein